MQGETKNREGLEELNRGTGEKFQIIGSVGENLHLKGEDTGRDIDISMKELFKGIDEGSVKLRKIPKPVPKIDGRKRKIVET